jgi:hypothetical protein
MGRDNINNIKTPLNNTFNIMNEDLENLKTINIGTPEWNILVGNKNRNETIPRNLQWRPRAPKMKLPAYLMTAKGGRRTRKMRPTKKMRSRRSTSKRSTLRHHRKFD